MQVLGDFNPFHTLEITQIYKFTTSLGLTLFT